jgi:predicted glycosyltransferase involved in capsule biosynthesis
MIPDYELMKYYVQSPKKGVVSLAVRGSRWSKKTIEEVFFGGVMSMSRETFQRINGFPNQFWGWGGEDRDVILRCAQEKIMNYKPLHGCVLDIEEYNQKKINIPEKLKRVSRNKETMIVEKQFYDMEHYKSNGWNTLQYEVNQRTTRGERVEQIQVDLKYEEDVKHHPEWFPNRYNDKQYTDAKNRILKVIEKYLRYSVPI